MKYLGKEIALVSTNRQRNEFGSWITTFVYEGVGTYIYALAGTISAAAQVELSDIGGGVSRCVIRYGALNGAGTAEVVSDRWEIDRENLEKDILRVNSVSSYLTDEAAIELRRWRADQGTTLNQKAGDLPYWTGTNPQKTALGLLGDLIGNGTESLQVSTLILKRVRTISTAYQTKMAVTEQTSFYTTEKLIALEGIPSDVASILPTGNPYAPLANTAWGWLPRQQNRAFIGRGQAQETCDWVYAAWSTFLYGLVR